MRIIFTLMLLLSSNSFGQQQPHPSHPPHPGDQYFCKDSDTLVNLTTGASTDTYPTTCTVALSQSSTSRGYFCKDTNTLFNLQTGMSTDTYPTACTTTLSQISGQGTRNASFKAVGVK